MQTTHSVPRSPLTGVVILASLLATLLIGGAGGYLIKSLAGPSVATDMPASASHAGASSSISGTPYLYVQGGRPAIVYTQISPVPYLYVQGGRPPVVYEELARAAATPSH